MAARSQRGHSEVAGSQVIQTALGYGSAVVSVKFFWTAFAVPDCIELQLDMFLIQLV